MFWDKDDEEVLWFAVIVDRMGGDAEDRTFNTLLDIIKSEDFRNNGNIYEALTRLAGNKQAYIIANGNKDCVLRGTSLIEQIHHSATAARASLRPSPNHSIYSRRIVLE